MERLDPLLQRLEQVLARAEELLRDGPACGQDDASLFVDHIACRWEGTGAKAGFIPIKHPHLVNLDDLIGIDHVKEDLIRNTAQFVAGYPANHVLLWGERGNGKSASVKGILKRFAPSGLRVVELQRSDLLSLPAIAGRLRVLPYRFIIFCDDLSFAEGENEYRGLKSILEGSIEERPENILLYATSNRRHLLPEPMTDNTGTVEIHPEEAVGEKLALADRFGLSLAFDRFDQNTYLCIVEHLAEGAGIVMDREPLRREALRWALYHNGRSGRGARQFVDDLAGRLKLEER